MLHPRNILIFLGALLLIFGGVSAWRASHPPLSDEQQIAANIEAVRRALESRDMRRISQYLADDFTWNGQNKRELNSAATTSAFRQWRDITANVSGLQISINKDNATTTGKFSVTLRPTQNSRPDAYLGDFKLMWQKRHGAWQVTKAIGGEDIP